MVAVEHVTVSRELSFSPLVGTTRRFTTGKIISLRQFDAGGYGTLYRCENEVEPLVVKLLHEGGDCRAIADLHSAIAKRANSFTPGWHAFLRGLPFWLGEVIYQGKPRSALISLDLEPLGFLQLKFVLERRWREYFALDLLKRVQLATSFVQAASILEDLKFLHADINTENVFVNMVSGEALLIDFDTGVLRIAEDKLPQTPGKPNEFLAPELKDAAGAQISKFNEEAERWAVGVMAHTLTFGVQPLFFLKDLSVNSIERYLNHDKHRWPELTLFSGFAHLLKDRKNRQREADFYLHFRYRQFKQLGKLRPEAHVAFRTFINKGALHPEYRPTARMWAAAFSGEKRWRVAMTAATLALLVAGLGYGLAGDERQLIASPPTMAPLTQPINPPVAEPIKEPITPATEPVINDIWLKRVLGHTRTG